MNTPVPENIAALLREGRPLSPETLAPLFRDGYTESARALTRCATSPAVQGGEG